MAQSFETFAEYAKLAGITDMGMLRDLYNATIDAGYAAEGIPESDYLDLMSVSDKAPESYKKFLGQYQQIKAVNPSITSVSDWMMSRKEYKMLMKNYNLADLATDENADQFMLNEVSASEAKLRLDTAYSAVVNADAALKEQLKTFYPSLKTTDIVRSMLGVGRSADELQKEIDISGIRAEAQLAGLSTNILDAQDLAAQGISRGMARQGFQATAQEVAPYTAAAQRAGIDATDLQRELAAENVQGLASQRRKRIQKAEQNLFEGSAGTASVSLKPSSAGSF